MGSNFFYFERAFLFLGQAKIKPRTSSLAVVPQWLCDTVFQVKYLPCLAMSELLILYE